MQTRQRSRLLNLLRPLGVGLCVSIITATLLLLGLAVVLWQVDIPREAVTPMAVSASAIGALLGGLTSALCAGQRGLLTGGLCGTLMALLLLVVGILRTGSVDIGFAAIKWAVMTLCGAIGGLIGINRKRR